ncbi:MAG: hypothetical protein ACO3A2_08565 [Bdellovibrionia bacterium]
MTQNETTHGGWMPHEPLSPKVWLLLSLLGLSCSSLPAPRFTPHSFPKGMAFIGPVKRPYEVLGTVRSRVEFISLDDQHEEGDLCQNAFNESVETLVKLAQKKGGQAVIDVRSVVFLEDGRRETYPTPECSDDGAEGQILTQATAIRWKSTKKPEEKQDLDLSL